MSTFHHPRIESLGAWIFQKDLSASPKWWRHFPTLTWSRWFFADAAKDPPDFPKIRGKHPVSTLIHIVVCVFSVLPPRYITLLFKHRSFSVYPPTECIHLGPRHSMVVMFGSQPSCQGCLIHTESWTSRRCRCIMWISTYGSWNWSNQVSLQHQKKMPNLPCEISILYPACVQFNTKRIASQQKNKKTEMKFLLQMSAGLFQSIRDTLTVPCFKTKPSLRTPNTSQEVFAPLRLP